MNSWMGSHMLTFFLVNFNRKEKHFPGRTRWSPSSGGLQYGSKSLSPIASYSTVENGLNKVFILYIIFQRACVSPCLGASVCVFKVSKVFPPLPDVATRLPLPSTDSRHPDFTWLPRWLIYANYAECVGHFLVKCSERSLRLTLHQSREVFLGQALGLLRALQPPGKT